VPLLTTRPQSRPVALDPHHREQRPAGPCPPTPRGPLSATVLSALRQPPGSLGPTPHVGPIDALVDDDLQLASYVCYELHYRGFAGVDAEWEWDPALLAFRVRLERAFVKGLTAEVGPSQNRGDVGGALVELIEAASGPSLSTFLAKSGTLAQLEEFCIHRSAYQLKEADPHTFAIPRLTGDAKAAMVEIQNDEYGSGRAEDMHSALFALTMGALGLDSTYGAYLDRLPAPTLATVNLVSMFGLHRRWRGALVGHLAVFEMTSVEPMRRYAHALTRLGVGSEGRRFYNVHVTADVRHAAIALDQLVAGVVAAEPELGNDLLFGAAAVLLVEERFARHLLNAFTTGRSSLIPPPIDLSRGDPRLRSIPRASPADPWPIVGLRARTATTDGDPAA